MADFTWSFCLYWFVKGASWSSLGILSTRSDRWVSVHGGWLCFGDILEVGRSGDWVLDLDVHDFYLMWPSGVIKWVCLPIHTHTNTWGRLKWPYAITIMTAHFVRGLISDMVICKFRKFMVIHDTECPFWEQVSLNKTHPLSHLYLMCVVQLQPFDVVANFELKLFWISVADDD